MPGWLTTSTTGADLGGVPAAVRPPRAGAGRDRADQGRVPLLWGAGQLITGRLSDTLGRKPLIVSGMLVQAAAFPAALALPSDPLVGGLASAVLLGRGRRWCTRR